MSLPGRGFQATTPIQPAVQARTSFFLYRMPSLRHDTALVTAMGGRACTCDTAAPGALPTHLCLSLITLCMRPCLFL